MEPVERSDRAELDALQGRALQALVERAWHQIPFYRERWEAARVRPELIRGLGDLKRLPVVTRQDLESDLLRHPPFGTYQGPIPAVRIHASSGTSGQPRPVFFSRADCERLAHLSARRLTAQGVRPDDRVQVALPYSLYIGGSIAIEGAMRLGAAVIPTGSGAMTPSRRQLELAHAWRTTVLCTTPSYALHLSDVAGEMGLDSTRDFQLHTLYLTAEVLPEETRRLVEQRWGCVVFDNYGSVEAAASTFECASRTGWHVSQDCYLFEILDLETGDQLPAGEDGVLVVTSLVKEAAPFIRYRIGDVAALWDEPCACGRSFVRLSPIKGRADDMIKLKGVSFYPAAVERVLRGVRGLGMDWRLIVDHASQTLVVEVEAADNGAPGETADHARRETLALEIISRLRDRIGVRAEVRILDPASLGSQAGDNRAFKPRRVIERREAPR